MTNKITYWSHGRSQDPEPPAMPAGVQDQKYALLDNSSAILTHFGANLFLLLRVCTHPLHPLDTPIEVRLYIDLTRTCSVKCWGMRMRIARFYWFPFCCHQNIIGKYGSSILIFELETYVNLPACVRVKSRVEGTAKSPSVSTFKCILEIVDVTCERWFQYPHDYSQIDYTCNM